MMSPHKATAIHQDVAALHSMPTLLD